jgi:hypothetical protein
MPKTSNFTEDGNELRQRKKVADATTSNKKQKGGEGEKGDKLTEIQIAQRQLEQQKRAAELRKRYAVAIGIQILFLVTAVIAIRSFMADELTHNEIKYVWNDLKNFDYSTLMTLDGWATVWKNVFQS